MKKSYSIRQRVLWSIGEVLLGSLLLIMLLLGFTYFLMESHQVVGNATDVSVSIVEDATALDITEQMDQLPYDYVLFDNTSGNILAGRHQEGEQTSYLRAFRQGEMQFLNTVSYRPYANQAFTLVLRLPSLPEFTNPALRFISYNVLSYILFFAGEFLIILWSIARLLKEFAQHFQAIQGVSMNMGKPDVASEVPASRLVEFATLLTNLQQKSAELAQLLEAERQEKKDLSFQVAALSHDVKTPLTVLKGNLELLEMTQLSSQQQDFLLSMQHSLTTFERYFNAMLDYTRLLYHEPDGVERIEVAAFLEELSCEMENVTRNLNIEWSIEDDSSLSVFHGNHLNLSRAVINILTNAIEHAKGEAKRVQLNIRLEGDELVFQIWNSGQGFSEQALQQAYKLFFTEDKGRNNQHYGIGLSFAHGVAKQHKGKLTFENPPQGGALVCLYIKK